jgi:endonuclease YncB( thermonuclease family)
MLEPTRLNPRRRRIAKAISTYAIFFRRHRGKAGLGLNGVLYTLLVVAAWGSSGHVRIATGGEEFSGGVTRIVDGDTFRLTSKRTAIRLWGVDAPEVDENGGAQATAELKRISLGDRVHCKQMAIDRYGRIVARCLTDNGDDISELMIESGAADEYVFFTGGFYAQRRLKQMFTVRD